MRKNKGISLIVLVITIIIIIILAGGIILNLIDNNLINQADKATFMSDVRSFQMDLELYKTQEFLNRLGGYNPNLLQADETSLTYDNITHMDITMNDIIPSLGRADRYQGQFEVIDGQLVYKGTNRNYQEWIEEIGGNVVLPGEPTITIIPPVQTVVSTGADIIYTIRFSSSSAVTTIDLTNNIEIIDNEGVTLVNQPVIVIGTISGTATDVMREVDITIKTDTLIEGAYKVKVKEGTVTDADGISNTQDVISPIGFDIDNTAPENPIMSAEPATWTNGNVTVTIIYSEDSVIKEYSLNGTEWSNYTDPIIVTENNVTVYARGKNTLGNESGIATLTVTNIDKIAPTVIFGPNGGTSLSEASTTVTINDLGGSGVNSATLQYIWDTQSTLEPSSGWSIFANSATLTETTVGTYYLWIKASDNAGNSVVDKSNAFVIEASPSGTTYTGDTTGFAYNNPIIPTGFTAVNTTDANWNNLVTDWDKGLVIRDAFNNEFVWVPVDGVNVAYEKWGSGGIMHNDPNLTDDTLPSGFSTNSITTKYQGFYIARYEAMFDFNGGNIRVASKKSTNKTTVNWSTTRTSTYNGYVWNVINYTHAKYYSENMATSYGYDLTKVGTNLVTGTQWDTTMKWIQNSGRNVSDSRAWGNHTNSISPANITGFGNLQISGFSEIWKAKNIYDIAGNLWEWTNEIYNGRRVLRSGVFSNHGNYFGASFRYDEPANTTYYNFSFRPALFIL